MESTTLLLAKKGEEYYNKKVLPAFDGHLPSLPLTIKKASFEDNGWSLEEQPDERLPRCWRAAFRLVPDGKPEDEDTDDEENPGPIARDEDVTRYYMRQDKEIKNTDGKPGVPPTDAFCTVLYLADSCAIILSDAMSPTHMLQRQNVSADEINSLLPPLHRLSDVLWAVWANEVYAPGNLRYFAFDGITNSQTQNLMIHIFQTRLNTIIVPWEKRLTFSLDSQEGKALFGSPLGVTLAWILIHRAEDLGMVGRRTPHVTIFNPEGKNVCMIWDLIPGDTPGVFGDPEKKDKDKEIPGGK
ncbi:MAG: hypothetical protein Q9223_000816 [Gallowayella weberi]